MEELDDRSKDLILDILLLALSRSTSGGVGLGFRTVLRNTPEMFKSEDGRLDLVPVWRQLEGLPNLDLERAKPALLYFKKREKLFGPVNLPELGDVEHPPQDIINAEELERFFGVAANRKGGARSLPGLTKKTGSGTPQSLSPPQGTPREGSTPGRPLPLNLNDKTAPGKIPSKEKRRAKRATTTGVTSRTKLTVAIVLSVVCLGLVLFVLVPTFSRAATWKQVNAADFAPDLPVSQGRQRVHEMEVTLTDPGWLKAPEEQRIAQLKSALERLRARDADTLIVKLGDRVKASAAWMGSPPQVRVRFY